MKANRCLVVSLAMALAAVFTNPVWSQMGGGCGMNHQGSHSATHEPEHAERAAPVGVPSPHGGIIHMSREFQFETVFTEDGMRVYLLTFDGAVMSARDVEGTVKFKPLKGKNSKVPLQWVVGNDDPTAQYRVRPGASVNQSAGFLMAPYDFRSVAAGSVTAEIDLRKLPGEDEKKTKWTEDFQMTPLFGMACPMHPDQASLESGKCKLCGMDLQPAYVFYTACPACGDVRRTVPGKCEKCGMELTLKAVGGQETSSQMSQQPRQAGHSH